MDLVLLMMQLGKRNINTVWVESGAHFAGALLEAGLVDELIVYIAPKILGMMHEDYLHFLHFHHYPKHLNLQ